MLMMNTIIFVEMPIDESFRQVLFLTQRWFYGAHPFGYATL